MSDGFPTINDANLPVLREIAEGRRNSREAMPGVVRHFGLGPEALDTAPGEGAKPRIMRRIAWCLVSLSQAGLIEKRTAGHYEITESGRSVLAAPPPLLDHQYLLRFPGYASANGPGNSANASEVALQRDTQHDRAPDEIIRDAARMIERALERDIVERLHNGTPAFFEKAVVELLLAMGYGRGRDGAGRVLGRSGDGGIDGLIDEDALGLDRVYMQAKRYAAENTIGRPAIQQFVGSLTGEGASKGVFVTTSGFSREARDYAERVQQRVILIDGARLARLMIAYGVGVRPTETITLSEIDENFFAED
ncbi:restriction endonuclease [Paralimibaculum aggregatum]|uniref:Restriction endonuclease n=1 Tax=Paralimibaculum aggregatum TaxID=3036245 RepID=A0ABQ6LGT3_9RHOB|nr:restriction endonuclease [Limibaculum sp. NKW23]GMG82502.1 restriction endonuclease [Limibaculum sp. NKW23]